MHTIRRCLNTNLEFDIKNILRELGDKFCVDGEGVSLNGALLVSVQHILETTVDMLSVMAEYGLKDAVIGGKSYSTHQGSVDKITAMGFTYISDGCQLGYGHFDDCMQSVVHRVWAHALEKIKHHKYSLMIILDDGADLLRSTPGYLFDGISDHNLTNKPEMIIGIEQTRGGTNHPLFNGLPFPIINVAGSFAKTCLEYRKVAEAVSEDLTTLISRSIARQTTRPPVVGILGCGAMGQAVARKLLGLEFSVNIFDPDQSKILDMSGLINYNDSAVMIANSDIVIGCTGSDVTSIPSNLAAILYSRQRKWLLSTGSKDHEFNTLLRVVQHETKWFGQVPNPFDDIRYTNYLGATISIIRGGFPVNFKNTAHSVPPEHIWPTRAALMLACLFAADLQSRPSGFSLKNCNTLMLSVQAQHMIIIKYLELNPNEKELELLYNLSASQLADYIGINSDGVRLVQADKENDIVDQSYKSPLESIISNITEEVV